VKDDSSDHITIFQLSGWGGGGGDKVYYITCILFLSIILNLYRLERDDHLLEEEFTESLWKNKIIFPTLMNVFNVKITNHLESASPRSFTEYRSVFKAVMMTTPAR
jgi:hypothetical protein